MSKNVLIVSEKPSVGMAISKIVGANSRNDGYMEGNGYLVSWCVGHLIGLAEPEEYGAIYAEKPWKVENLPIIPDEWKFTVNKSTKKQFEILKKLMNSADVEEIVNACDAGREGECIFRYVYNATNCKKNVKRLWVSSLEVSAIKAGLENLRPASDYDNLFDSGICRAKADWLFGMNGTRLFSAVYRSFLSVGRVQTPTLAMIVERDYKVKNFVKEKYFTINLDYKDFTAATERIDVIGEAEKIKAACTGKTATVTAVTKIKKTENPPKLYDLTTLQREANRLFSFSAQKTLDLTQGLYEKRLVTYPRTDSQYITEDMADSTKLLVEQLYGKFTKKGTANPNINISRIVKNSGVSDHHAILPTMEAVKADLDALSKDEGNILMLVIMKLNCAVENPYIYEAVTAKIKCEGYNFTAKGRNNISLGWKQIELVSRAVLGGDNDNSEKEESKSLSVSERQTFTPACDIAEKWTSPPRHYTEDTLLSSMETAGNKDYIEGSGIEKKGLGTPATRANIIETLIRRGYIERQKKNLIPTDKCVNLIKTVPESVKSLKMTAEWETKLQKIAKGESSAADFMAKIEVSTRKLVADNSAVSAETANVFSKPREIIGKCPKCGDGNITENSKAYSCDNRLGAATACEFLIWKSIASKSITAVQAKALLEKGKTAKIKGFKSKAGKNFDAALVIKSDFTVGFEF